MMAENMKDYYGDELKTFIIEIELNHETRYVRTKKVAIYSKEIARKFAHKNLLNVSLRVLYLMN